MSGYASTEPRMLIKDEPPPCLDSLSVSPALESFTIRGRFALHFRLCFRHDVACLLAQLR